MEMEPELQEPTLIGNTLLVDTQSTCFLCLGDFPVVQHGPNKVSSLQPVPLRGILSYLKLDPNELIKNLRGYKAGFGKVNMFVFLCVNCRCVSEKLSEMCHQLQVLQLKTNLCVDKFHKVITSAEQDSSMKSKFEGKIGEDPLHVSHFKIANDLRQETKRQCQQLLSLQNPKVILERVAVIEKDPLELPDLYPDSPTEDSFPVVQHEELPNDEVIWSIQEPTYTKAPSLLNRSAAACHKSPRPRGGPPKPHSIQAIARKIANSSLNSTRSRVPGKPSLLKTLLAGGSSSRKQLTGKRRGRPSTINPLPAPEMWSPRRCPKVKNFPITFKNRKRRTQKELEEFIAKCNARATSAETVTNSQSLKCPYCSDGYFPNQFRLARHQSTLHAEQRFLAEKSPGVSLKQFKTDCEQLLNTLVLQSKIADPTKTVTMNTYNFKCFYCQEIMEATGVARTTRYCGWTNFYIHFVDCHEDVIKDELQTFYNQSAASSPLKPRETAEQADILESKSMNQLSKLWEKHAYQAVAQQSRKKSGQKECRSEGDPLGDDTEYVPVGRKKFKEKPVRQATIQKRVGEDDDAFEATPVFRSGETVVKMEMPCLLVDPFGVE